MNTVSNKRLREAQTDSLDFRNTLLQTSEWAVWYSSFNYLTRWHTGTPTPKTRLDEESDAAKPQSNDKQGPRIMTVINGPDSIRKPRP